jgi:selenide,water dikinase
MNLLGVPTDVVPPKVINAILRGGAAKVEEAKCALVGGHTIRNPEPIYGLAVTGLVNPRRMITNTGARPGDWLILTKPLGIGIITTGIKRALARRGTVQKAVASMCALNVVGAELAERGLARAGTDVTGYGLLGHLGSMCRASGVGAEIDATRVPVLSDEVFELIEKDCIPGGSHENLKTANESTGWKGVSDAEKILFADAQTSGGLLLCVRPRLLGDVLKVLKQGRTHCAKVIGRIVRATKPNIFVISSRQ